MADHYAESSALVKRHVNEIRSGWFRALADPATGNVIITSRVSIIEAYSAFNRRVRELIFNFFSQYYNRIALKTCPTAISPLTYFAIWVAKSAPSQ